MRILITNDDGVHAEGIHRLARVAREHGQVVIVAPDRERSACGHSMTMRDPLRVGRVEPHRVSHYGVDLNGVDVYQVNGVPVDCVNVGLTLAYPDGCDVVLSGMNHGPNLGFDITYSGTVAGAMEGAINGIRSLSFSLACFVDGTPLHWDTAEQWLREHLGSLLALPHAPLSFVNVNIPNVADFEALKGTRVVSMGQRVYKDRVEVRADPWGRPYYWQGGVAVMDTRPEGTDAWAVNEGYVAVTPLSLDWTQTGLIAAFTDPLRAPETTRAG